MSTSEPTFVFIGDTAIGESISRNLSAGGFRAATDVASADVVFIFTHNVEDLENVCFDTAGLISVAAKGTVLVDLGSVAPSFSKELSALATVSDIAAVDAPLFVRDITRTDAFADPDNLMCVVGADDDAFAVVEPLLRVIASDVELCGGPGAGQTVKAALTVQSAAATIACMEGDALARVLENGNSAGLALELAGDTGAVGQRVVQLHRAVTEQRFDGSYTVGILMTELVAALSAAADIDLILPQSEAALQLLELISVIGGADKAPAALSLIYADEEACAEHGLDWSLAESTYGEADDDCDCGHDHHHVHGDPLDGFDGYSPN